MHKAFYLFCSSILCAEIPVCVSGHVCVLGYIYNLDSKNIIFEQSWIELSPKDNQSEPHRQTRFLKPDQISHLCPPSALNLGPVLKWESEPKLTSQLLQFSKYNLKQFSQNLAHEIKSNQHDSYTHFTSMDDLKTNQCWMIDSIVCFLNQLAYTDTVTADGSTGS